MTETVIRSLRVFTWAWLSVLCISIQEGRARSPQEDQTKQEGLKQLSLEQLGDIDVTTVSKEPEKARRTTAAITVITQEDIRRSGVTSIPEALRLVPGVEVARIDSNQWSVSVRGFGSSLSRSVLVLIDGRSVYTPLFAGVFWNVQDVMLQDVDRIEVIRGPGGTIWGANAVNAVINIITKNAKDTQGTLVTMGGGSVDQGTFGFRHGGGNGRDFNYRIYGKGFTRGPEFHPNDRRYDDWRMDQGGFRADWDSSDRDSLTIQGDLYNGDAGGRTVITTYSPPSATSVEQNAELSGGNVLGRWRHTLGSGSDVELQAYYDETNRHQASFAEVRNTFDVDFVHHLRLPRGQDFIWGLGARISAGDAEQVIPTIVFTPGHLTDKLYSAFVQDEIPMVGDELSLTVGAKVIHNIYTGFEVQPAARLLWTPDARQTLWGAVTRAVRTPSRIEEDDQLTSLISPNPLTYLRLIGNRKFFSEQLVGYEFGYRNLVRPNFSLDIETFYNNYDHLLSIEPGAPFSESSPPPPHLVVPYFIRNGILGSTSGVEIAPDWRPTRWWRLEGSYSYLSMDLRKRVGSLDVSTVKSTQGSSPHHQVVIQSFLDLPMKFEFDQTYRFVSALPAQRVESYSSADTRFGWRPWRNFEFSIVGADLLQPHHFEFAGGPQGVEVKRSIYAEMTLRQ